MNPVRWSSQAVQSSGESSKKSNPQWSAVRHLVAEGSAANESGRMRTWASGVSALKRLTRIHSDLIASSERSKRASSGEYGICRFRTLRLGTAPGSFEKVGHAISFGDLYRIEEISAQRGWFRISSRDGLSGWIECQSHFGLSHGEYKILASFRRNHRANFIVNALSV